MSKTIQDIKNEIELVNSTGREKLAEKGVEVAEDWNTLQIVNAIGDISSGGEEQEKTINIVENGTTEILPDEDKVLSRVIVNADVQSGGDIPANAKIKVVKYTEDGLPLEIDLCAEGDTSTPKYTFGYNTAYVSDLWSSTQKINLPLTVTKIDKGGLLGLKKLIEVTNWDNIESIETGGFSNCILKNYDHLPPKLTAISDSAFENSQLSITELPDGVTTIGKRAFAYCYNTPNIKKLPCSLVSVGDNAFYNNGLPSVSFSEVPASVKTIGVKAFRGGCVGIEGSLTFKGTPTTIAADAFELGKNITDVYCPWGENEVANAPWGMTNATIHYNYIEEENTNADS